MPKTLPEWLDYIERQHPKSIDMGLERVRAVAARLGLKKPAKKVITVGGTNGKGSTVAFIEAIARAAGWKVGAYTSPHLLAYNERVRIDGLDADDAALVAAFAAIEAARGDTPLTYFEYGTLAALWLFAHSKLDLAILEVGLGGRLDATNLVDPDVAVITTVDLDHQDYLGDDIEAIGFEKAGIARAWKPLVLGDDDPPASVLRHAYAIGANTLRAGCDFFFDTADGPGNRFSPTDATPPAAGHWTWRETRRALQDLPLPRLAAPAQLRNAATAIAALRALGKALPTTAVAAGVAQAHMRGRLQRFMRKDVEVVVDVGHNPQAARELARWLATAPTTGRTHAVFAALGDKDVRGVVEALAGRIDAWHLAGLAEHGPRGVDVDAFAARLAGTAAGDGARHATVERAIHAALEQAAAGDRVLVFGSFHTAADALAGLEGARS
ncbi:bifunctional tetrahydrofolate synthase/dihydrofolate synthase [Lysobacter solisilvae (ex Woo and Kim 2020)]|uniref:Dihydrofolate synthase/folylpolyglutamate synthase n=1 Tax=Agrilutibacter terrestris TaxID=2865112 RepID=A0A7H0FV98_9GAMM|nr:bifunctional tetrahydrofolate synthase/dihydrofolate synthase [Lysobacter terrestris]QNP39964.1 bifunctional tetrahydrofolate synthase/dihydrofolate synthase [Lysobacter terrestris]